MAEESLESFLEKLGLKDTIDKFKEEDIDLDILLKMTPEEMKEIGLTMGKRKRILEAIQVKKNVKGIDGTFEVKPDRTAEPFYPPIAQPSSDDRIEKQVIGNYGNCHKDWKEEEIRIVMIGKTGSGKSATGNSILGGKMFKSSVSASSVTSKSLKQQANRFDKKILIVDTPGIFDTMQSNEKIQQEIAKSVGLTSPGTHAFILVLSITRYTKEEHESIMHFVKHFGDGIFKYFIVLFTRKDDLDEEGITIFQHIKTVPQDLKKFIKKCGERVIAFNNRLKGDDRDAQVIELLSMISKNVEKNGGECYTNEMYRAVEKLIKDDEEIKKARLEREKEMKEIERKLDEKYEGKFAKEREKDMERMMHEVEKRYRIAEEKAWDRVRDEIEEEKGLFTKITDAVSSGLAQLNPLNWFS